MREKNSMAILIGKRLLFFSVPLIAALYFVYEVIFGLDMSFSWMFASLYAAIIGLSTALNYKHMENNESVESFEKLEYQISKGKWDVVEKGENSLVLRPKFDFPYNKLSKDMVEVEYSDGSVKMSGPHYYLDKLSKDIRGKGSIWTRRSTGVVTTLLIFTLVSIPILGEMGMFWKIKMMRHNSFINKVEEIEFKNISKPGNLVENTNNYGYGVEDEENIYYVEDHLNLVRVDKDLRNKTYLIQKSGGTGINRLNIVDDWIYYMSGESLNRIKTDGTVNETIYKQGYLLDINIEDGWICFINPSDRFYVYKMDLNGRGLERFLDVEASDISIYDKRLYLSHEKTEKDLIESIKLDGSDRRIELESYARDILIDGDYMYFINDDYGLYRASMNGSNTPELLVGQKVSSFTITDMGIFYSLHGKEVGYPGDGLYLIQKDGSGNQIYYETFSVEGLAKVGKWLLFHSFEDNQYPTLKRIDLETGEIRSVAFNESSELKPLEFETLELTEVYTKESPQLNDGLIIEDGIEVNVKIKIPQVVNLEEETLEQEFNEYFINEGQALLDKAIEYIAVPGLKENTKVDVIWNYKIARNDGEWLSVIRGGTIDFNGQDTQTSAHTDNFMIKEAGLEYVYLDSIFTIPSEEYRSALIRIIEEKSNGKFTQEDLMGYFDFNNFYIADNELVIFYQEATIAPRAQGIQEFWISFSEIEGINRGDILN